MGVVQTSSGLTSTLSTVASDSLPKLILNPDVQGKTSKVSIIIAKVLLTMARFRKFLAKQEKRTNTYKHNLHVQDIDVHILTNALQVHCVQNPKTCMYNGSDQNSM